MRTSVITPLKIEGPGVQETWHRVPRDPEQFAKVLNGRTGQRAYIGSGNNIFGVCQAERDQRLYVGRTAKFLA